MLRDELVRAEIDGRDPAVLVVDRANLDRDRAAVVAPFDAAAAAVFGVGNDAHRALFRLVVLAVFLVVLAARRRRLRRLVLIGFRARGLFVFLAHAFQRIVVDARQVVGGELVLRMRDEIEQQHRLRRRIVAADARALVFLFLVAGFGDEVLQLAGLALVVALRRREHEHPASVGTERSAFDLHVVAEVERLRRAAGIGLGEFLVVLLLRVVIVP